MNILKNLPLTETTYYILLALRRAGHGYAIMQRVEELSDGKVRIAAGTMYGALENLSKQKLIISVPSEDARRKMYQISSDGIKVLALEVERLKHLVTVYERTEMKGE
ncbi:helix-turn-helix transcriptional regulator [Sedimentibacter sp. zth1]|uniref:PadR family transcriptional regulator n=1 Tax=Sedimentibacter sp. zth1 TaxID=2816908 RepID=UPI001A914C0F|nr:PadR family transcriptional regulator [Sedimentibacter sp. zth1]QSX06271.1 helix-turn-helix transcriptional regulator [Sedimentibacter sp. zth1]